MRLLGHHRFVQKSIGGPKNEGKAVHRHNLLNEVWGYDAMPTTRTVDNFIMDLRKKLEEDPSNPKYFMSVRGVGYRFVSYNE